MHRRVFVSVVAVGLMAAGAQAGTIDIRIDLSNMVSTTAGNWNNISALNGLTTGLIDFGTGGATGVSIDGTGSSWSDFFGDDTGAFGNPDWVLQPSTVDGAGLSDGETGSFTFSGLTGSQWRVEVVSARTTFGYLNTITAGGALADRTATGAAVTTPWNSTTDGLAASNWLIWDNVTLVGGSFTLTDVADRQTLGMINAVRLTQIEAVPLPPAGLMGLGLLGVAGLVTRLRRRNRTAVA